MLKEGRKVFYIEDGDVHWGHVMNLEQGDEGDTFSIDSYGTCEGHYVISAREVGRMVFFAEEEARSHL